MSCFNQILETIDVEPVPCRIEHSERILPFQQFLEQLGDSGFSVARLGQKLHGNPCKWLAAVEETLRTPSRPHGWILGERHSPIA